jgi:hypothetical protein
MFDRQKLILVTTKYASYLINIVIVGAVLSGIALWIHLLILSAK